MRTHRLKTDPEVFQAVVDGRKTFEIRLNDRDFQEEDELILKETEHTGAEMKNGKPLIFTGREEMRIVSYVLRGPIYGLHADWCILSPHFGLRSQAVRNMASVKDHKEQELFSFDGSISDSLGMEVEL